MAFRILVALIGLAGANAVAQTDAEKILSASHVAVVAIRDVGERHALWDPIDVSIIERLKGDWEFGARVFVRVTEGSDGLKKGSKYLIFCSAANLPERGIALCTREKEVVPADNETSSVVIDRLRRIAADQHDALKQALRSTMLDPPMSGEVPKVLTLLFDEATQRTAIQRLIALPQEANKALAMHVYDTRPIPKKLLSPDEPITFHTSPVAECQCVQDVVIWILGIRMRQSFGYLSESPSFASRMAISDAWFYWVMAEK